MRREVLDQLTALRARVEDPAFGSYEAPPIFEGTAAEPKLTVSVRSADQITPELLAQRPAVLYVPVQELLTHTELPAKVFPETELCAILPRILPDFPKKFAEFFSFLAPSCKQAFFLL